MRFLRAQQIEFAPHLYPTSNHGGTAQSAACLGVDEHSVIKTIVLTDECKNGLIVLMHGDRQISYPQSRPPARPQTHRSRRPRAGHRWTGYLVGGTSPFGCKSPLPVYVERSILDLPLIYINGGKRGFLLSLPPAALASLNAQPVDAAV